MAKYNEKDIPDSRTYPAGKVSLRILSVKHSKSEEIDDEHPLMIEVKFEILAHSAGTVSEGAKYTERFRLGTAEDPLGESPATRKEFKKAGGGWQRWLELTKKTGVFVGDTEEEADALDASKPDIVADMEKREGKGTMAGRFFNGLTRYYSADKAGDVAAAKPASNGATKLAVVGGKKHCPQCDQDVSGRFWDAHMKRHEQAEAESDEVGDEE